MENIKLKGAKNTRDLGGIINRDGKQLKNHCFLRSAALNKITKSDIKILTREYQLKTIIDLRTNEEITEKPDIVPDGVTYRHIPIFNEETAGITHGENSDKKELISHLPELTDLYKTMVTSDECIEQLRKVFEVIISSEGCVLWHCTEGKDRCGIVSALFLLLMDVDLSTVYEDYLYTNNAPSKNGNKYYFLVKYLMRDKESAEKIRKLFSAEKEFLDAALNEINKNYGDVDSFIRNRLCITDDMKLNFKNKYFI